MDVLDEIEQAAQKRFLPIVGPVKGKLLSDLAKKHKPKRILEIGVLVGYSSILMARNCEAEIVGIEINAEITEVARKNIIKAGLSDRIEIVVGDALTAIPKLKGKFDFVFIDAAKESYLLYLKLIEPKMNPSAIVVADNVKMFASAVENYLEYVRTSKKYKSKYHDFGYDAMEVSLKK